MMTAQFFLGASLSALLIVDICCLPVKNDLNPATSHGSSYTNAAPSFDPNQGATSSHFSPVMVMPDGDASHGVYIPSYESVPQRRITFSHPLVQREPAAPVGSSSSSGPKGDAVRHDPPVGSTPSGAAFQPAPEDNWAVAPPSIFSGGEEMPAGSHGGSEAEYVSPPRPPPGPMYQAGELDHFEKNYEHGDYQMETEEQGYLPPPPMHKSAGPGFTSVPQPESGLRGWGIYPYYDYMFLTGQYPPGTVSHFSNSFEQGTDHWQDAHYVRYYSPYNPGPAQTTESFPDDSAGPQRFEDPQAPVRAGYGAPAGLPGSSYESFVQPSHRQTGVHNPGKADY